MPSPRFRNLIPWIIVGRGPGSVATTVTVPSLTGAGDGGAGRSQRPGHGALVRCSARCHTINPLTTTNGTATVRPSPSSEASPSRAARSRTKRTAIRAPAPTRKNPTLRIKMVARRGADIRSTGSSANCRALSQYLPDRQRRQDQDHERTEGDAGIAVDDGPAPEEIVAENRRQRHHRPRPRRPARRPKTRTRRFGPPCFVPGPAPVGGANRRATATMSGGGAGRN